MENEIVTSTDPDDVSKVEVKEITDALNELIVRRTRHHSCRYLGIINSYLEVEFNILDDYSLEPINICNKSQEAFWHAFSFYIGQDALSTFFEDNLHLFKDDGIFYELAWAHSYVNYLKNTRLTHQNYYE